MFFENNNDYLNYDLDIFYTNSTNSNTNNSNIQISENYLKYNKYVYIIDMSNKNNSNSNPNSNSNSNPNNTPNFDNEFKNLASAGMTMVDTFFKSVAPVAKTFSEKMTEIDDILKNPPSKSEEKSKAIPYFKHEDNNFYYYVLDFPRANKDSCRIDINNNTITVIAETEVPPLNYEFLPNNKYEINLNINFPVNRNNITANYLNGSLYITISKNNNDSNNININILD